jgi:hypothetical protein
MDCPPEVARHVQGSRIEVASCIQNVRAPVILEIEILELRPHKKPVALFSNLVQQSLECIPGVPLIRRPIRVEDVTEHPGHRPVLPSPGHQLKGLRVRHGDHVAFLDPGESLYRRSVKAHPLAQALLQLRRSHGKTLEKTENIREPELDETDVPVFDDPFHVLGIMAIHGAPSCNKSEFIQNWSILFSWKKATPYARRPAGRDDENLEA